MKNTMYTDKKLQLISLSQKGKLSYFYNENKIAFFLKKKGGGVLLDLKISDFGRKFGVFLAQNPRKGGMFQAWVRAWYTFWSGVGGRGYDAGRHLIISMYMIIKVLHHCQFDPRDKLEWNLNQNTKVLF